MKAKLLLTFLISIATLSSAQVMESEDFEGLNIGNIGAPLDGSSPGQGGYFIDTESGAASDFQVVSEGGNFGNVIQIIGPSDDIGLHFLWKSDLSVNWPARTTGNDVLDVEFDFFSGPATSSANALDVRLYNETYSIIIAGLRFETDTKIVTGIAYFDNAGTIQSFTFNLGPGGGELVLDANNWYRMGFSFDKTTGIVIWRGPGFAAGLNGAAMDIDPFEVDLTIFSFTGNASSATHLLDNYTATARESENLLSIEEIRLTEASEILVFPNPATNQFSLKANGSLSMESLDISDINGRVVKTIDLRNTIPENIDISSLDTGMYLIRIRNASGSISKRLLKH